MVFEGAWTKVDEVFLGSVGGRPAVAIGLDVRQVSVDKVSRAARSCLLVYCIL